MNNTIKLTCECGQEFERPIKYKTYNEKYPNVMWRWKLAYCDACFTRKADKAMKKLPGIINAIINDSDVRKNRTTEK